MLYNYSPLRNSRETNQKSWTELAKIFIFYNSQSKINKPSKTPKEINEKKHYKYFEINTQ